MRVEISMSRLGYILTAMSQIPWILAAIDGFARRSLAAARGPSAAYNYNTRLLTKNKDLKTVKIFHSKLIIIKKVWVQMTKVSFRCSYNES